MRRFFQNSNAAVNFLSLQFTVSLYPHAVAAEVVEAPRPVEEVVARDCPVRVLEQIAEYRELLRRSCLQSVKPSISGSIMSSSTRSMSVSPSAIMSRASPPFCTAATSTPLFPKYSLMISQISASSSTRNIFFISRVNCPQKVDSKNAPTLQ